MHSIVRPHLEYAVTVCMPLYKKVMVAIEKGTKESNTKLVRTISHLSYHERPRSLGLPSLEYRRERGNLVEIYKIMNGINDVVKDKFFKVSK